MSRRHALPALAAAAAALALSGCGPRAASSLPPGVEIDGARPGALAGGIYAKRPDEQDCCWADREARFRVAKPEPDSDFMLRIYVPDVPAYRRTPQTLSVELGGWRTRRCCLAPGSHTVLLRLPEALRRRTGTVDVVVRAGESFVPVRAGLGTDPRRLAYILVAARFTSFMAGRL